MGIAAELRGDPKCKTQNPLEEDGPRCKHHNGVLQRGSGEVFFLDILSHRMSVMAMFHQLCSSLGVCPPQKLSTLSVGLGVHSCQNGGAVIRPRHPFSQVSGYRNKLAA